MTSIPASYRKLLMHQMETRLNSSEVRLHVRLMRLTDPQPTLVFEGETTLGVQHFPSVRGRGRKRQQGPNYLVNVRARGDWAEYSARDLTQDGSFVLEDYLLECYGPDGLGPTTAEQEAAIQQQIDSLLPAALQHLADSFIQRVHIGDQTYDVAPAFAPKKIGPFATIGDLKTAINGGEIDPAKLIGFICKGELFIRADTPQDIFTAFYGSRNACVDICALLGIINTQDT